MSACFFYRLWYQKLEQEAGGMVDTLLEGTGHEVTGLRVSTCSDDATAKGMFDRLSSNLWCHISERHQPRCMPFYLFFTRNSSDSCTGCFVAPVVWIIRKSLREVDGDLLQFVWPWP